MSIDPLKMTLNRRVIRALLCLTGGGSPCGDRRLAGGGASLWLSDPVDADSVPISVQHLHLAAIDLKAHEVLA